MRRADRAFVVALVMGVPCACGSGSGSGNQASKNVSCAAPGICPGDPAPAPEDVAGCEASVDDPICGAKYQALRNCAAPLEKCGPNGVEDSAATLSATTACSSVRQDWNLCVRAELDAGSTE